MAELPKRIIDFVPAIEGCFTDSGDREVLLLKF
jgi:hypothetical protein